MKRRIVAATPPDVGMEQDFDEEQAAAGRLARHNRNAALDRQGRKRRRSDEDRSVL